MRIVYGDSPFVNGSQKNVLTSFAVWMRRKFTIVDVLGKIFYGLLPVSALSLSIFTILYLIWSDSLSLEPQIRFSNLHLHEDEFQHFSCFLRVGKPRSSSIPAESVITQQVRPILTNATLPQALPIEEVPASSEEATPTTPVVSPMPSAESSSSSKVCTPLPSPPFLLLSQEVRLLMIFPINYSLFLLLTINYYC